MRVDLRFSDRNTEAAFERQQKAQRRQITLQFGTFRCAALLFVAAKALLQVGICNLNLLQTCGQSWLTQHRREGLYIPYIQVHPCWMLVQQGHCAAGH